MNLFHFKIGGTVFSSNSLHTKWFSWCLLKILIRNSRRGASVRKRIFNFLAWNFRWMSLSYLYIFFLVNGETLIWTSRGAGKLGYVEKWQRQRTNISQWLWQHGEKTQVDVKSGAKLMETFSFFLRRIFPKNVGQEDPTVWIGYIFMIAISLFHSRISIYCFLCQMTFCREFL